MDISEIADIADINNVRALLRDMFQGRRIRWNINTQFTLVNDAAFIPKKKFDWVFN